MLNLVSIVPPASVKGLSLGACIAAIIITTFRLVVRRRRRWWWDDLFAFLGALAYVIQVICLWCQIYSVPGILNNQTTRVALYYVNSVTYYMEDWFARLAVLYSIIRISPDPQVRVILHFVAILYYLGFIGVVVINFVYCELSPAWHQIPFPFTICNVVTPLPWYQLAVGIFSDALLIYLPMRTLRQLTSAPVLRRRLIFIFSASIFMTLACIVEVTISLTLPGEALLVAALAEGFVALFVCNLAVTAVAVIHLLGFSNGLESPKTSPGPGTAVRFRTPATPSIPFSTEDQNMASQNELDSISTADFKELSFQTIHSKDSRIDHSRSLPPPRHTLGEPSSMNRGWSIMDRWRNLDVDDDDDITGARQRRQTITA